MVSHHSRFGGKNDARWLPAAGGFWSFVKPVSQAGAVCVIMHIPIASLAMPSMQQCNDGKTGCTHSGVSMLKLVGSLLAFVLLLYAGACVYLYVNQRAFLYFPTPAVHLPDTHSFALQAQGETLKIWRIGQGGNALIYFGGNAEDVAQNIPQFAAMFARHTVYLVNYRGYGGSTGKPTEAGFFQDAIVLYDALRAQHREITVIGRSLGSGVALFLASVREVHKLVLVTPYDSIARIAQRSFPAFPISVLLTDKFDSSSRAAAIQAPTLVMLAEVDLVIPRANSEALIAALINAPAVSVDVVPATDHNSISTDSRYWKRLREFL